MLHGERMGVDRSWAGPTQVNLAPGPVVYAWKARGVEDG